MQIYTEFNKWFQEDKLNLGIEFANLPYMIHGDMKIAETHAIHQYLGEAFDQTLMGKTAEDKGRVEMLLGIIKDMRYKIAAPCYQGTNKMPIMEEYRKVLPTIVAYMGENEFLIGDYVTYIDFYFFETIQLIRMITESKVLKEFPSLDGYC